MLKQLFTAMLLFNSAFIFARDLDGVVKDSKTGEPLVGAVIQVKERPDINIITGLDGTFKLSKLPQNGKVTLVCSYIAYRKLELPIETNRVKNTVIQMEEESTLLSEVTISASSVKNTDRSAVGMERTSSQVLNVMSAQSIQLTPDVNVASTLQRVSGVTMQKDATGEASYAILRGMDKRYNYTLVNGVKIPSPDDKNRYVPLNIFPNDLMDRLIVSKTLTPDMEGDATGGAIDMVMKDAPGHFSLQANAAVGYSDYFLQSGHDYQYFSTDNLTKKAPYAIHGADYSATESDFKNGAANIQSRNNPLPNINGGFSIGNRLLNGKLGVLLAGSIQNRYRGTNRTFYSSDMSSGKQAMDITSGDSRKYSYNDFSYGAHAKLDLNLGNHKLEWYNMYVNMGTSAVRLTDRVNFSYGYEPEKGNYTLNNEFRTNKQTQDIFSSHLKGTHKLLSNLSLDWSGVFARAASKEPDRSYLYLTSTVEGNDIVKTYIDNSPGMERRFQNNTDKDWSGYINLKYNSDLRFADAEWKVGAMYRRKERESRYYSYTFRAEDGQDVVGSNSYEGLQNIDWVVKTPHAQASQLNYDSKEHIGGSYAMFRLSNNFGELVAGLRAEHTNQIYTMLQNFENLGQIGEQSYWDYLPSVALKVTPVKSMNVRLSYYKSINRPGFFEIVPYKIMGDDYDEAGNPGLKRSRIDNVDLRWEWFPSANEQVFIGLFYKYLKDPIEMSFSSTDGRNMKYMPQNLGNAKNLGFEVDLIKYIRNFGIKANYTYTHSSITSTKMQYPLGSSQRESIQQERKMANQAPHIANLSLLYKDTKYGWNAQVAGAYTGERLAVVSYYKDADQYDKAIFTLDFSAEKKFKNGVSLFLKANNLLDTTNERYLKTVNENNFSYKGQRIDRTVIGTYNYGRTFMFGVRYSM